MNNPSIRFDAVKGLGTLQSVHGYNPSTRNNRLMFSGLILAGMFGCLCLSLYGILMDASAETSSSGVGFTIGMVVFFMLLGLFVIYGFISEWWRLRNFAVALYSEGIAISDAEGRIHVIRADAIKAFQVIKYKQGFRQYFLATRDSRQFTIHHNLEQPLALEAALAKFVD